MRTPSTLLIVLIAMFLSACATTQPMHQFEPGTRIGLMIEDQGTTFCHDHTGVTVFGNFTNVDYEINLDSYAEIQKAFQKVADENQQPLQILAEPDLPKSMSSYFTFSSWSGDATIKPDMAPVLRSLMERHELDVLVLRAGMSREEYAARPDRANIPWCDVRLDTLRTKDVIVNAKFYFHAISAEPLASLGSNAGTGGVLVSDARPADLNSITSEELESYVPHAREGIERSVRDFFFELGLGEPDFVEPQHSWSY